MFPLLLTIFVVAGTAWFLVWTLLEKLEIDIFDLSDDKDDWN